METTEIKNENPLGSLDFTHYDSLFKCMTLEMNRHLFEKFNDNLPADKFAPGKGRYRRYSRFNVHYATEGGVYFLQLPHEPFFQSDYYNKYVGGEKREYEELEDGLVYSAEFQQLLNIFIKNCHQKVKEIGIHQIKVVCSKQTEGVPVPEGFHQDGFDQIGMYCVTRNNIVGGETSLVVNLGDAPFFNRPMLPGEMMIVNDRKFYHYVGPVKAGEAGDSGIRSMFIITALML